MLTVIRVCLALTAVLPLSAQSLDWTGDLTLFGSTGNEISPLLVAASNGNAIRAFCLRDDSLLCSKISADGGAAWSASADTNLIVFASTLCAAADDRYQYLFIRHAAAPAAFLMRCSPTSTNWHSFRQTEIAPSHTADIVVSALMVDALFEPAEPYLNLCWVEREASSSVNIWFAQSRDRGETFRAECNVHSFVTSAGASNGLAVAASWNGEDERLLIAAVVDRPGSIPEEIRVFVSDDQGETWADSSHVDESAWSQTEPALTAFGANVVLAYLRSVSALHHELCLSFSFDGGQTFAPSFVVSDTLTDEHSPRLLVDPADSVYFLFSLLAEDSASAATVLMRSGDLDRPWNISEPVAISEPAAAVLEGGLTAIMNANGLAVAWTGRFPLGDTDIRFDAAWRGSDVSDNVSMPTQIFLGECYPNPFNAATVLPLVLNRPSLVSIELFDILGRRVAILRRGWLPAGKHPVTLDLTGFSSGVYLSKVADCGDVRRLILIR